MKLSFLLALLLYGCAAHAPAFQTASNKPEVTIRGIERKALMDLIVNAMVNRGFTIRSQSDYQTVFAKPSDSSLDKMLYGTRYDTTPEYRVSFTAVDALAEGPKAIRLIATIAIVTNPGSAFEKVSDLSRSRDAEDLHREMERLKARLES